jgi:hypothetical protein
LKSIPGGMVGVCADGKEIALVVDTYVGDTSYGINVVEGLTNIISISGDVAFSRGRKRIEESIIHYTVKPLSGDDYLMSTSSIGYYRSVTLPVILTDATIVDIFREGNEYCILAIKNSCMIEYGNRNVIYHEPRNHYSVGKYRVMSNESYLIIVYKKRVLCRCRSSQIDIIHIEHNQHTIIIEDYENDTYFAPIYSHCPLTRFILYEEGSLNPPNNTKSARKV